MIAQAPADMWRKLRRSRELLSELLNALGILPFPHTSSVPLPVIGRSISGSCYLCVLRRAGDPHRIGGQDPLHEFAASEGAASRSGRRQKMCRGKTHNHRRATRWYTRCPRLSDGLPYRQLVFLAEMRPFSGRREAALWNRKGGPANANGRPAVSDNGPIGFREKPHARWPREFRKSILQNGLPELRVNFTVQK